MTILVEDGTIVSGANSYISTTGLTAYATARGISLVSGAETLLIQAMDWLEQQSFIGYKQTATQNLQWPRYGVYIDGYYKEPTSIPQQLINGQCEIALAIDAGNGPLVNLEPAIKREKVGPLETEYMDGTNQNTIVKKINNVLWKILAAGNGANNIKLIRA